MDQDENNPPDIQPVNQPENSQPIANSPVDLGGVKTKKRRIKSFALITVIAAVFVISGLIYYRILSPLIVMSLPKDDWSTAFTAQPKVIKIPVGPTDGTKKQWIESDNISEYSDITIRGGETHWLATGSIDVPNNIPARLWYDGKLIATTPNIGPISSAISPNGLHYIYTLPNSSNTDNAVLYIDGKPSGIQGKNIQTLGISNDGSKAFYLCSNCDNKKSGLWQNMEYIGSIDAEPTTFQLTADGSHYCIYSPRDNNYKGLMISDGKMYERFKYCSPNAQVKAYQTGTSFITTNVNSTLHVSGRPGLFSDYSITENLILHTALDDKGNASYLASDGTGGGDLVIKNKRYSYTGLSVGSMLFSPDRENLLIGPGGIIKKGDKVKWYLNGHELEEENNIADNDFQLTDTTLYIYQK